MSDAETQQRFVQLRTQGWSFSRIADELKISKPTLINWSRKFQFEIQNHRSIHLEGLREKWLYNLEGRLALLGEQLRKVEAELVKRHVTNISTPQLFTLYASLRRQIKDETKPVKFSAPVKEIPKEEYHEQVQDWNP